MKTHLEPAWVLHSRSFRETSLLLEVFSREQGRVGLVARGARGAKSRWKNMLQPFRPMLLSWSQRSDLGTLTGAEQVASPPALGGEAPEQPLLEAVDALGDPEAEVGEDVGVEPVGVHLLKELKD